LNKKKEKKSANFSFQLKKEGAEEKQNVRLEGQSRYSKLIGRNIAAEDLFFQLHLQAKNKSF
jgi:hypothetical protein